jgi:hypothetical protein
LYSQQPRQHASIKQYGDSRKQKIGRHTIHPTNAVSYTCTCSYGKYVIKGFIVPCIDTVDFAECDPIFWITTLFSDSVSPPSETDDVTMQNALFFVEILNINYVTNIDMYTQDNLIECLCFPVFELPVSI